MHASLNLRGQSKGCVNHPHTQWHAEMCFGLLYPRSMFTMSYFFKNLHFFISMKWSERKLIFRHWYIYIVYKNHFWQGRVCFCVQCNGRYWAKTCSRGIWRVQGAFLFVALDHTVLFFIVLKLHCHFGKKFQFLFLTKLDWLFMNLMLLFRSMWTLQLMTKWPIFTTPPYSPPDSPPFTGIIDGSYHGS